MIQLGQEVQAPLLRPAGPSECGMNQARPDDTRDFRCCTCRNGSGGGGFDNREVEAALHRTFAAMDFEILAEAARTGARCGSTAVTALQLGADLYLAHTGKD